MQLEKELKKATSVKFHGKRRAVLEKVISAIEAFDESQWDSLSDLAQGWFNKAIKQSTRGLGIVEFDKFEAEYESSDESPKEDEMKEQEIPVEDVEPSEEEQDEDEESIEAEEESEEEGEDIVETETEEEDEEEMVTRKAKKAKTKVKASKKPTKKIEAKKAKITKKVAEPKKVEKRLKAKTNGATTGRPGVMSEIKKMLQQKNGATINEVIKSLVEKFPDRSEEGMGRSTKLFIYGHGPREIGKKLKKIKDEKRGKVFYFPV